MQQREKSGIHLKEGKNQEVSKELMKKFRDTLDGKKKNRK